jgi:hypothetical protein
VCTTRNNLHHHSHRQKIGHIKLIKERFQDAKRVIQTIKYLKHKMHHIKLLWTELKFHLICMFQRCSNIWGIMLELTPLEGIFSINIFLQLLLWWLPRTFKFSVACWRIGPTTNSYGQGYCYLLWHVGG